MNKTPLALCISLLLVACSEQATMTSVTGQAPETTPVSAVSVDSKPSESERLNQWFADKFEQQLQRSPLQMTVLGRKDKYDQIDDVSEQAEDKELAWLAQSVEELKANFDYAQLTDEAQTSYDIWIYQYEQAKQGRPFRYNNYIFTQMQGMQALAAQFLISFHRVDDVSDMQAYNKRISGMANAISVLLERAKLHAEKGVRPPKFAYQGIIEQAQNLITGAPFSEGEPSALYGDATRKVNALLEAEKIDQQTAQQLLGETSRVLKQDWLPAYQSLIDWFSADMVNSQDNASGVGSQPNGEDYYNYRLKASTTTNLTAEQIHQLGLDEVARLQAEMREIMKQVEFEGTLTEFFRFIKTDDRFYYPNTDEGRQAYIDDTEQYLAFINQQLPKYFGILPKADLVVKRVEPFREQDGAAQHYSSGTPDGSRPGVYYAHLSDMRSMPKNEMEAIAYHEGNPGHHMQISIAQELTSVPQFRTQAGFTAYIEGWGLYAELLAKEMGAYQDPYSDFGRLITEIWRAVRLVVDTGLHAKGWTEQQAIEYFKANSPVAEEAVVSEVRRYLVWPGQATAYKIGMLKILELRAYAEQQLGESFDIRGFHDTILGGGAMPLDILERRVKQWVETQKQTVAAN
ncbi:DUF885 domain-containing protein [Thalassotalea ponticola]|uniref:DUF885 domain-containing protein n=1 Tax=Thalassotalea ponticola TaxID=1523392 RepID=UPI0025B3FAED|nr:DUF885 domain-containing protein [Thalassotalea ponticola]MDN3653900.1 DUF885 domain-containing protein [Thalassotalea ponticola]